MHEITIHGRGGQGSVTTGQIMAISAFYDGKYCQSFPKFGVERAGAPVQAFTRIDKKPINVRSEVYSPDVAVVLDSSLLKTVDITKCLKKGATIIINSNKSQKELGIKGDFDVHIVDATDIAIDIFKRPIVNTPMLGAFAKITGLVTIRALKRAVDDQFQKTKGHKIAMLNKKAIEAVYKATV